MPSSTPFGMSIAGMHWRATSPDTNPFDTKSLVESLDTLDAAVDNNAGSMVGPQSPEPSSGPAEEKSAGTGSPNLAVTGADNPEEKPDKAEKGLWDEVKDIITTFGPLVGAVKIKIPGSKQHILVHGCLLIGKSAFCRAKLTNDTGKGKAKVLVLPTVSSTTLALFLKWVYSDTVLPAHGTLCPCCAKDSVSWPDLVSIWVFAGVMGMPKLQNHAIDILVGKMDSYLYSDYDNRSEGEIDHIRAAFSLLWPGKNNAQGQMSHGDADKPIRKLMLDWFANPLYQTKAEADQLWAGGLSRTFYRDYALYAMEKNFSMGDDELDDEVDPNLRIKAIEAVAGHTLACLWKIKSKNYYVNDKAFAAPVGKKK